MLPSPTTTRYQPLRSGLVNLFKYQDQEFWYERGRLLIRGNNGTGKSRVLALQLPFLLDGEISSRRVEPDGDPARHIAWHLLMDEHDQRTGYTWIEFGRRDESGADHFLTLGCGMRAVRGGDNQPTRWFFITERRVGRDIALLDGNHPLSAERLSETLGPDSIYKIARDYRAAIDQHLFGIGPERYQALIDLLIRLRAPQLAKKLNPDTLFAALSDALPPLPDHVVEKVAAAFKDLDDLREQHANLRQLARALASFCDGYRAYLQTALLRRAEALRKRHAEFETAQRQLTGVERDLAAAQAAEAEARATVATAHDAFATAEARYDAVQQSSRSEDARTLDYAKQTAETERRRAGELDTIRQQAAERLAAIEADRTQQTETLGVQAKTLVQIHRHATELAAPAGFAADHTRLLPAADAWPPDHAQLAKTKQSHQRAADDHLHRLDQIDTELAALRAADDVLKSAQQKESALDAALSRQTEILASHNKAAHGLLNLLSEAYTAWHATLRWLSPPPWSELAPRFSDWLETADDHHRCLAEIVVEADRREAETIATLRSELKTRQDALDAESRELTTERDALAAGPPSPARSSRHP